MEKSRTYQNILDDLRDCKITPALSNTTYVFEVQSWYWKIIVESDLPINCHTLQNWVENDSEDVTKYFKRIWEDHKTNRGDQKPKTVDMNGYAQVEG